MSYPQTRDQRKEAGTLLHREYDYSIRVYWRDTGRFCSIASGDDLYQLKDGILEMYDPARMIFGIAENARLMNNAQAQDALYEWVPDPEYVAEVRAKMSQSDLR